MECQSRATVKLSSAFQEYSVICEHGGSAIKKGPTSQDFLLLVSSPKFVDGASVMLIG